MSWEDTIKNIGAKRSDALNEIIKVMKEVNDEVVNNLKEGFICEDINKVASNIYNNYGLSKFVRHRIGHGMGFEGHEAPWLSPGDKTLLTKNMVFSNEPGIYRPGVDGYRTISSMIVDKEKGIQIPNFLDKNIEERIINLN